MPGVCLQRSPDFAAIDCQCTEMLPDDWTSAAGPSAVPRVNRRAFPYCPLDVRRIPPVTKTPGPGHTQSPQTTQDSTAKSRRRYSDGSPSPQPPEPDAHTHALSPCSLVLHSLPVTHTGAKWGRQPITTNRERFQHLVRLHLAIIDLFCDSVSTMTPTAQRWTPQLPTTTRGLFAAIPCGEFGNRFLRQITGFINVHSILIGMVRGFPGTHGVDTDLPQ